MYNIFPLLWCSKIQTEIYLSAMEAEYIYFGQLMRDVLLFVSFWKEVSFTVDIHFHKIDLFCKVFEKIQRRG